MKCEKSTVPHVLAKGERNVMLSTILSILTKLLLPESVEKIRIFIAATAAFGLMFAIQMRLCFGTCRRRIKLIPVYILLEEWLFLLLVCIGPAAYTGGLFVFFITIGMILFFSGAPIFACTAGSLLAWGIYGVYLFVGTHYRRRTERKSQNAETPLGHETVVPGAERIN